MRSPSLQVAGLTLLRARPHWSRASPIRNSWTYFGTCRRPWAQRWPAWARRPSRRRLGSGSKASPPLGQLVAFDGFTFLTPLQRLLVDRMAVAREVVAIFPHRSEQGSAFQVIKRTYDPWWPTASGPLTSAVPGPSALSEAKEALFAVESRRISGDGSLRIQGYDDEHDEARACQEELARGIREFGRRKPPWPSSERVTPQTMAGDSGHHTRLAQLPATVGIGSTFKMQLGSWSRTVAVVPSDSLPPWRSTEQTSHLGRNLHWTGQNGILRSS